MRNIKALLLFALILAFAGFSYASTRAIQIDFLVAGLVDPTTGEAVSLGTVEFYEAGTTTEKSVWTEKEKTNAYTIYTLTGTGTAHLYGEGNYKVVVKDLNGATIRTLDNIRLEFPYWGRRSVISTGSQLSQDDFLLVNTTSGAVTINLLPAADWTRPLKVEKIAGSNSVTLEPNGSETITVGGVASANYSFSLSDSIISIISDGSNLRVAGIASSMTDADGDTGMDLDRVTDDDTIYLKTGGTDRVQIDSDGLTLRKQDDTDQGGQAVFEAAASYTDTVLDQSYENVRLAKSLATDFEFIINNSGAGNADLDIGGAIVARERTGDKATAANESALYTKEVSGSTEWFFRSESNGTATQITTDSATKILQAAIKDYGTFNAIISLINSTPAVQTNADTKALILQSDSSGENAISIAGGGHGSPDIIALTTNGLVRARIQQDGTVNIYNDLDVGVDATVGGTLDVTGAVDFGSTLDIGSGTTRRVAPAGTFSNNSNGNPNISDTALDVYGLVTVNQWWAVYPTGGTPDETHTSNKIVWSALDSVPDDADWVEIRTFLYTSTSSGTSGTLTGHSTYIRQNGSSQGIGSDNCSGSARSYVGSHGGAADEDSVPGFRVALSDGSFDVYRVSYAGASFNNIYLYLTGWGYNP